MSKPFAFHDLPADHFPLTMRFFRVSDDEEVHTIEGIDPYTVVTIPGLAVEHGRVWVRIEFANGLIEEQR